MDRDSEVKLGRAICNILEEIRSKVLLNGMAVRYHLSKAAKFPKDAEQFSSRVELEDSERPQYLEQLPELMTQTRKQDELCTRLWHSADIQNYEAARMVLVDLLVRFRFTLDTYDRLVRFPDKQRLDEARVLIRDGKEKSAEAQKISRDVRMTLPEYISVEEKIEQLVRDVDQLRQQFIDAHMEYALSLAKEYNDDAINSAALFGLKKAAQRYEPTRGYRFATYAKWWIWEEIKRKKESSAGALRVPIPEPLKDYRLTLENYIMPCIGFDLVKLAEYRLGASKIGGNPDLPDNFDWPVHEGRKLDFLLQINLCDVAKFQCASDLPSDGLLSFFFDLDRQPWGFDPNQMSAFSVRHTPTGVHARSHSVPRPDVALNEAGLKFRVGQTLPYPRSRAFERMRTIPFTPELRKIYKDYANELARQGAVNASGGDHRMFGHSANIQGDMQLEAQMVTNGLIFNEKGRRDPRVEVLYRDADDWQLLLQLDSDDGCGSMWGDCGMLYVWIRKDDLKAHRFDGVWMGIQCY